MGKGKFEKVRDEFKKINEKRKAAQTEMTRLEKELEKVTQNWDWYENHPERVSNIEHLEIKKEKIGILNEIAKETKESISNNQAELEGYIDEGNDLKRYHNALVRRQRQLLGRDAANLLRQGKTKEDSEKRLDVSILDLSREEIEEERLNLGDEYVELMGEVYDIDPLKVHKAEVITKHLNNVEKVIALNNQLAEISKKELSDFNYGLAAATRRFDTENNELKTLQAKVAQLDVDVDDKDVPEGELVRDRRGHVAKKGTSAAETVKAWGGKEEELWHEKHNVRQELEELEKKFEEQEKDFEEGLQEQRTAFHEKIMTHYCRMGHQDMQQVQEKIGTNIDAVKQALRVIQTQLHQRGVNVDAYGDKIGVSYSERIYDKHHKVRTEVDIDEGHDARVKTNDFLLEAFEAYSNIKRKLEAYSGSFEHGMRNYLRRVAEIGEHRDAFMKDFPKHKELLLDPEKNVGGLERHIKKRKEFVAEYRDLYRDQEHLEGTARERGDFIKRLKTFFKEDDGVKAEGQFNKLRNDYNLDELFLLPEFDFPQFVTEKDMHAVSLMKAAKATANPEMMKIARNYGLASLFVAGLQLVPGVQAITALAAVIWLVAGFFAGTAATKYSAAQKHLVPQFATDPILCKLQEDVKEMYELQMDLLDMDLDEIVEASTEHSFERKRSKGKEEAASRQSSSPHFTDLGSKSGSDSDPESRRRPVSKGKFLDVSSESESEIRNQKHKHKRSEPQIFPMGKIKPKVKNPDSSGSDADSEPDLEDFKPPRK